MTKKQDSGLSCFMIVMKFHGVPITKEQAENLSVLDKEQKISEIEIIQSYPPNNEVSHQLQPTP